MSKKIVRIVKLQLLAGKATPGKPVGPALAPLGVNVVKFCKEYNDQTMTKHGLIPAEVTVFDDRTYRLTIKLAPAAHMIREVAGIGKGSAEPNKMKVGSISRSELEKIAIVKITEMNAASLDAAVRMLEGTARSMGVVVTD